MDNSVIKFAKEYGFEEKDIRYVNTVNEKNVYQLMVEPFTWGNPILIIEDDPVRFTTVEESELALYGKITGCEYTPACEPSEPSDD